MTIDMNLLLKYGNMFKDKSTACNLFLIFHLFKDQIGCNNVCLSDMTWSMTGKTYFA